MTTTDTDTGTDTGLDLTEYPVSELSPNLPTSDTSPVGEEADDRHRGAAWLQCTRESYGLSIHEMSELLQVTTRTLRAWEAGRDEIPPAVPGEVMEKLVDFTDRIVDQYVERGVTDLGIWRDDEAFLAVMPLPPYLGARWWRQTAYEISRATGARLSLLW